MSFLDCLQMLGAVRPVQRPPSPEQRELAAVDFGWAPATGPATGGMGMGTGAAAAALVGVGGDQLQPLQGFSLLFLLLLKQPQLVCY